MGAPFGIGGTRAETDDEFAAALEMALGETAEGRSHVINAILPG